MHDLRKNIQQEKDGWLSQSSQEPSGLTMLRAAWRVRTHDVLGQEIYLSFVRSTTILILGIEDTVSCWASVSPRVWQDDILNERSLQEAQGRLLAMFTLKCSEGLGMTPSVRTTPYPFRVKRGAVPRRSIAGYLRFETTDLTAANSAIRRHAKTVRVPELGRSLQEIPPLPAKHASETTWIAAGRSERYCRRAT